MARETSFRQATDADAAAVRALTRAAYLQWVKRLGREPKPMTADYELAVRRHRIELLHSGDTLVGLIELVPERDCVLIENVAVLPAHQRCGYGRLLLARAEAVAAELGLAELRLYTNTLLTENIRLYERLGYTRERDERHARYTAVHMRKTRRWADGAVEEH